MHRGWIPVAATALALMAAAPAGAADFTTSFEASDAPPTYTNTSEASSGVSGTKPALPGSVMDKVSAVTANAENPPNEIAVNLKDGDVNTKWLSFTSTGWAAYQLSSPVAVQRYQLASANDSPNRDPQDWQFQGSNNGTDWTTLDTRTGQSFAGRFTANTYDFTNATAYSYYRLNITRNHGENIIQLSELVISDGSDRVDPPTPMRSEIGNGPVSSYTAKSGMGWTGLKAFRFGGSLTATGRDFAQNRVFDVDIPVTSSTELSYKIFPEFSGADQARQSTYSAVDLQFDDGTYLRDLGAIDQHGYTLNARAQGESKSLYPNQWNAIASTIGAVASGKTIKRILVDYDNPNGQSGQAFQAWIDDLKIVANPATPDRSHLADWVETRRGTNANGSFSRGNNIPATAVPHGFNFWVPETAANSTSWLYTYQESNNANNKPQLQAFAASHEPSPWMGDRQTFQVMPSPNATPTVSRSARALEFSHDDETAKPYYYGVTFTNGLKTEIAPTDHAAVFRFTFTGGNSSLIFDNVNNNGGATLTPSNGTGQTVLTGYSDVTSGSLSVGARRMFIYATFDQPSTGGGTPASTSGAGGANVTRYLNFDTSSSKVVTMKIATSFISVAQAQHNLELELTGKSFDDVKTDARAAWDKQLGVISVEGATPDQSTTLYSDLYRLNLYPNSAFENMGSNDAPDYKHAPQASTLSQPGQGASATEGVLPVDGKMYVNNGFWDTYRTVWASSALLYPSKTGEMVGGFVQQYKDGGWIARWSSPGYADLMDGASSDVAFATAYLMGAPLTLPDARAAFESALRNSAALPPNNNVGRKGMATAPFLGYTATGTSEAFSWAVDGYINDFGVANMAKALYDKTHDQEYWDDYVYFLNRSTQYVNQFDPAIGFFQSRNPAGAFTVSPANFDPTIWGNGSKAGGATQFTETDPWNMQFTVPQDGNGLANLYGGKAGLGAKLDQFFSTPEAATGLGSYGTIHEMTEASAVRMGQWGLSNQPSHHIPYMYDFAGQAAKGQALIREALQRQFIGSEIGQGYPGDEDNGELSAWQIMSALGIYPLQMGSANWAVGSPQFAKATIHLENGKDIVVNAPNNSTKNVYVQGLKINGQPYSKTSIPHDVLANGATLDFDMGASPSTWGSGADDAPPSITKGSDKPAPLMDATTVGGPLFDNSSSTSAAVSGTVALPVAGQRRKAELYTITSANTAGADPTGWTLQGSNDGSTWFDLDKRANQTWMWRQYTRPFTIAQPGYYSQYRLVLNDASDTVAELELLAAAPVPGTDAVSAPGTVGGTVPATLALTLGPAASFGAFTPGIAKDYSAATTANVTSTAGDAALSVSQGRLTNGAFSLAQPVVVTPAKTSWPGPVSNDAFSIGFTQSIGANEALRTGTYSTTLTFTLSTTNP